MTLITNLYISTLIRSISAVLLEIKLLLGGIGCFVESMEAEANHISSIRPIPHKVCTKQSRVLKKHLSKA